MADDSELDYIRTYLQYTCPVPTVKHFSEIKKISSIKDTRRVLVFPGQIISVDGKFYKKRYKVQLSEPTEAELMETFNNIVNGIITIIREDYETAHYTGTNFDCSSEDTSPKGICWDGTHFYVLGGANDEVYQYNAAGVYTTVHFDVNSEDPIPLGIGCDGTYLWVSGGTNNKIYKYTTAGVYTGVSFDVHDSGIYIVGICWDGTHLWMVGADIGIIFKYTAAGVYTGVSFDVSSQDDEMQGICWDGSNFWINGSDAKKVYKYTAAGVYRETYFDISSEVVSPIGICWDDTHLWIIDASDDDVHKYNRDIYAKPSILCYIKVAYGNKAFEHPEAKRWSQELYLDVEWCTS